ncbi:hypothetical protein LINPERHAP1_LOCUS19187, partial [Linum perenne]
EYIICSKSPSYFHSRETLFLPPPFPPVVLFSPVSASFSSLPSPQQRHLASPSPSRISHLVRRTIDWTTIVGLRKASQDH